MSARQILLKADRAQQRCGIDIHYKEIEDLSPVALRIERAKEKLMEAKRELEKIQNLSRRSSGVLEDLVKEQEALEMRRAEAARRDFEERQASARRQVQATASIPRPDDPPLFSEKDQMNNFPQTKETIEYLKNQLNLMKPVIDFLEAQAKESLDSRSGCYMVNPRLTVTPRDLLAARQDWHREVRDKITGIFKFLKQEKELNRQCLDPLCDQKKGKSRWILCPVCKRGYCTDHSSSSTMQTHINSCLPQTPSVVQYPSVHVITHLNMIELSASSIQITTTITTTPTLSPISPLRDDVNCQLDICSICQLYISDPTQGCSFCQHPGFGNISVSLSVSNSPQSPDLELAAEISGSIRAESSFQSQKGDHSSLSIDAHTSPERHLFEQNTFQSPLPSKSRCVSVQSVTIMIRKALKVCPGCGMSRTLEECFNGHQIGVQKSDAERSLNTSYSTSFYIIVRHSTSVIIDREY